MWWCYKAGKRWATIGHVTVHLQEIAGLHVRGKILVNLAAHEVAN